jgi:hypothetical protein
MTVETSMLWFDHVFPPFMILAMPLLYTIIPGKPSSDANAAKARQLQRLLWVVGVVSVAIYFFVYHTFGGGQWRQLWTLCFLQMPIIVQLMRVKNPAYTTPNASQIRVAVLENRDQSVIVPVMAWLVVWMLWGTLASLAAYGFFVNEAPSRLGWLILMFVVCSAVFLAFGPALVKRVLLEPEPMDPNNSPALHAAYEKHRRARSWVFFAMPTLSVLTFGLLAVSVAWLATSSHAEAQIGLYGGLAGGVIGTVGAGVGIGFGVWRAKLNQTIRDLSAE